MNIDIKTRVEVNAAKLGGEFAKLNSEEQARFLWMAANHAASFNWCMQSSYIAKDLMEFDKDEGRDVVNMLETLLDHIKNPEG